MKNSFTAKKICIVAAFTALNVVMSSFGVPVPGGKIYLNDVIICFAALMLDPFSAFVVGGVGAFLGDLFFYPAPMFVSLATHGLQAVAISLIAGKKSEKTKLWKAVVAVSVGAVIMIVGYTLGRAFVYGTPEKALIKLPFQIGQAATGAILGSVLYYKTPVRKLCAPKLANAEKQSDEKSKTEKNVKTAEEIADEQTAVENAKNSENFEKGE